MTTSSGTEPQAPGRSGIPARADAQEAPGRSGIPARADAQEAPGRSGIPARADALEAAGAPVPAGPPARADVPEVAGPPMRADARRNRERLLAAATAAFTEHGADAPLEDIARRAGVGIGTLYRHFPTRLALQEGVFRSQVDAVCERGRELAADRSPGDAFGAWLRALSGYLATKRGLSRALIETLGKDSELMSSCSQVMRATAAMLLERAQEAGAVRADISAMDVMRLVHGVAVATEHAPGEAGRLLSLMLDGLRVPAGPPPARPVRP